MKLDALREKEESYWRSKSAMMRQMYDDEMKVLRAEEKRLQGLKKMQ